MSYRRPDSSATSLPTPTSSPYRSRVAQRATPPLVSRFDQYMTSVNPHHQAMTEQEIKDMLYVLGATDATLHQYLDEHNRRWDAMYARAGGNIPVVGQRPTPDDRNVYHVDIPGSRYSIRMWDGGMNVHQQFCLDFFDNQMNQPINKPEGYEIHHAGAPSMFATSGPLISWEDALKHRFPEAAASGVEKFSVPEGTQWRLKRPRHADIFFAVPRIPAPAAAPQVLQPVLR